MVFRNNLYHRRPLVFSRRYPQIYLDEYRFGWEELLGLATNKFEIEYEFENDGNVIRRNQFSISCLVGVNTKKEIPIDEFTREMLFLFSTSMLARYSPIYWNTVIEKKDYGWKIVDYLRSIQSIFPNTVFNYLHGEQYNFYPESKFIGYPENYTSQF